MLSGISIPRFAKSTLRSGEINRVVAAQPRLRCCQKTHRIIRQTKVSHEVLVQAVQQLCPLILPGNLCRLSQLGPAVDLMWHVSDCPAVVSVGTQGMFEYWGMLLVL